MRPQFNRRAPRASAALGAAALAVALAAPTAAAPLPASSAAPGPDSAPPPSVARAAAAARAARAPHALGAARDTAPAGPFAAPFAFVRHSTRAVAAAALAGPRVGRQVRHATRRMRLHAVMLHRDVLVGQDLAFVGRTRPGQARRLIGVQRQLGSRWVDVARARTDRHGNFLVRYWPHVLGRVRLRVRLAGHGGPGTTVIEPAATVFRETVASWYGPGGTTACGETLTAGTQGVANRTLPCGTMVTLRYNGRSVRVPVIDRGPFVAGRDYDLTYATKLALGAGDVTTIWASA